MAILEVHHIEKHFGATQVLRDISFSLEKGEALAIIGSSGSGKTTAAKALQERFGPNTMLISHDMVRMQMLHVWGREGVLRSLPLLVELLRYGSHVIVVESVSGHQSEIVEGKLVDIFVAGEHHGSFGVLYSGEKSHSQRDYGQYGYVSAHTAPYGPSYVFGIHIT